MMKIQSSSSELGQHAGLMIVDKMERVDELAQKFGFTGTNYVNIEKGTVWDRATMRTEHTNDIYIILLDSEDKQTFCPVWVPTELSVRVALIDIFEKYYGQKNIDVEFDIIAIGTEDFIYKKKHRGLVGPAQVFISKPY